jgi:D-lyxose ketol-isomerase
MKRSEINAIMKRGIGLLRQFKFHLPAFAFWTPAEWKRKGPECGDIPRQNLGWDITDFGSGNFRRVGLFIFTIRNGTAAEARRASGKSYAEKVMIVEEQQVTPTHFHHFKMEDIINRGGGELAIRLWNATADDGLARSRVKARIDGVEITVPAGGTVFLKPGESICLPPRLYHTFWGRKDRGRVLVGEVSRVNDDHTDNRFLDPIGRFPAIEEDVPPLYLLMGDYPRYYRRA